MTHLIDVHILHLPDENQHWWKLCQESLQNHPINIFNCDGIPNNSPEARRLGYQHGTAPYVSFIDPDDIVLPGTFQKCLDVLEENPDICGVYTLSDTIDEDGNLIDVHFSHPFREWSVEIMDNNLLEIHQTCVMRREYVETYYKHHYYNVPQCNVYDNTMLYIHLAKYKPWKAIDFVGYRWRKRIDGNHLGGNIYPNQIKHTFNYIKNLIKIMRRSNLHM